MNHPQMKLRVSFSALADRNAALHPQGNIPRMQGHLDAMEGNGHPSETSFHQDNAESASPSPQLSIDNVGEMDSCRYNGKNRSHNNGNHRVSFDNISAIST